MGYKFLNLILEAKVIHRKTHETHSRQRLIKSTNNESFVLSAALSSLPFT